MQENKQLRSARKSMNDQKVHKEHSKTAQLACLLAKAKLSNSQRQYAAHAKLTKKQWQEFWRLAVLNQVIPHLVKQVTALRLSEPPAMLVTRANAIRQANTERSEQALRLLDLLSTHRIKVVILKGYLFSHEIYQDTGYKKMNDVDILVEECDFNQASELLIGQGFRRFEEVSEKDFGSKKRHHNVTFIGPNLKCVIGLHWRLTSKLAPFRPDMAGIWSRIIPIQLHDVKAYRMCWEDNLVHLALHLPFFKIGLRELADGANVIEANRKFDWGLFSDHVEAAKGHGPAYRYLSLIDALHMTRVPKDLLQRFKKKTALFNRQDTSLRCNSMERILKSRSVWSGVIEKSYVRFKKARSHHERIAMWKALWSNLLFPPFEEAHKLSPREPKSRMAKSSSRFVAPIKLVMAMAQEYSYLGIAYMAISSTRHAAVSSILKRFEKQPRHVLRSDDELLLEMLE